MLINGTSAAHLIWCDDPLVTSRKEEISKLTCVYPPAITVNAQAKQALLHMPSQSKIEVVRDPHAHGAGLVLSEWLAV